MALMDENEIIQLKFVTKEDIHASKKALIQYRHLYWACSRGYIFIVHHILKNYGVSPFVAEKKTEWKTPLMTAIEHNQEKVVRLLLSKQFSYPPDPRLIKKQMQAVDRYDNNPLHKACRFRNPNMIEMVLKAGIASVTDRNIMGKTPLEMPHNDILNDRKI